MRTLNREELIDLVENKYFFNVDNKNLEPAVSCFAEDAELTIQSAQVSHTGHDQIRRMFNDFMGGTKVIYHGDFSHVVDAENQWIASQFVAKNDYDDGRHVSMRNCNFFQIEDGRFKRVTIYMTDENPLV
jgi:ketosteroid isomerase-like protein